MACAAKQRVDHRRASIKSIGAIAVPPASAASAPYDKRTLAAIAIVPARTAANAGPLST